MIRRSLEDSFMFEHPRIRNGSPEYAVPKWRAGVRKAQKRCAHKRERRELKAELASMVIAR